MGCRVKFVAGESFAPDVSQDHARITFSGIANETARLLEARRMKEASQYISTPSSAHDISCSDRYLVQQGSPQVSEDGAPKN